MTTYEEYKADLLSVWAWLKAHPKTLQAVGWFLLGFVVGKLL